jgi:hypothetical protein
MNQKIQTTDLSKEFMAFRHTKKVGIGPGSHPRRPDPDPTKKVLIRLDPDPQHWL